MKRWVPGVRPFLLFAVLALPALYANCQPSEQPGNDLRKEVVLTVGEVSITSYELEKNYSRFTGEFRNRHGKMPGKDETANWLKEFTDRAWFLADAFKKGYFNDPEVNRSVESMAHLIIAQPGGLLEQKLVEGQLTAEQKAKIRQQYAWDVNIKARMQTDTAVLNDLGKKLKEYGAISVFDKSRFGELLPRQVLSYNLDNEKIHCTVEAVMDFYNSLPLRKTITSMQQVVDVLQAMVFDAYAYNRARELGITNEPRFLLDKENYRKTVVYNRYETNELKTGMVVTEEEVRNRYNAHRNEYRQAATAIVSLFSFNNRADAMTGRITIIRNRGAAITEMRGLQNLQQQLEIDHDQSPLTDTITRAIFDMKVQAVSRVFSYKDNFLVVYKASENGSRVRSLEEMKPYLIKEIELEKLQRKKQMHAAQLQKKYRVTNRIDMQKYSEF
jgi:hypothetical protein